MRGPGAVPGLFATESAYDELAIELGIDPVQLRLRNEPKRDQDLDVPFSSRHYAECLTLGAEKFGWSRALGQGRFDAQGRNDSRMGNVAGCSWIAGRFAAEARVELRADGSARVAIGTQDIGTGTYTVLAQIVAEATGIPIERIVVESGRYPLAAGADLRRLAGDVVGDPRGLGGGAGGHDVGDRSRDGRRRRRRSKIGRPTICPSSAERSSRATGPAESRSTFTRSCSTRRSPWSREPGRPPAS